MWFNNQLVIFLFVVLKTTYSRDFGPYIAELISVEDVPNIPRKIATWQIRLTKVSKTKKELKGFIEVFSKTDTLKGVVDFYEWSTAGWKKSSYGQAKEFSNVCSMRPIQEFFSNCNVSTILDKKKCIISPGKAYLQKYDFNKVLKSTIGEIIPYGKFRSNIFVKSGNDVVLGVMATYEFKDADLYGGEKPSMWKVK